MTAPQPPWPASVGTAGYLDAASAAPLHPAAREALLAALADGWADPERLHREGRQARLLLDAARESVAAVVGARRDDVTFVPNGTAAAQVAVTGLRAGRARVGRHLVHSAIEHSAVLRAAADTTATTVPVDRLGLVDVDTFAAALRPDTAAACLITASHEVGTVQPVGEVAERCAASGVPLFVDAAQSLGRMAVPDGWSVLTGSARKWGGPPGVGVLVVRPGTRFVPPWPEAADGRSTGALDLPAVVAAAVSLQAVHREAADDGPRLSALVDRIRAEVPRIVTDVEVVGHPTVRLPHLVTFSCLYVEGEALVLALDRHGFSVSSGSSCTSSTLKPSHVLAAMGVLTHGNVRVSLHRGTQAEDVERFLAVLPGVVADLRAQAGAPGG